MGKRRQWLLLLVRRDPRRDKTNAMQLASLLRRSRERQMATMNGIESPAEKPNVHGSICFPPNLEINAPIYKSRFARRMRNLPAMPGWTNCLVPLPLKNELL